MLAKRIVGGFSLLAVLALAGVNIAWSWQYWQGPNALTYQIYGIAMLVIEMTGLVAVALIRANGHAVAANAWMGVVIVVLVLNTFTDFSAITKRTAGEVETKAREQAAYDAATLKIRELTPQLRNYLTQLAPRGGDRPVASYQASLSALTAQRDAYVRAGRWPPRRLIDRMALATSDVATAQALARVRGDLEEARRTMTHYGSRPEAPPQYEGAARILASMGLRVSPLTVAAWLPILIAMIVKAVVVMGPWAMAGLLRTISPPDNSDVEAYSGHNGSTPPALQPQDARGKVVETRDVEEALSEFEDS